MGKVSLFASGLVLGSVVAVAGYIAWSPDRGDRKEVAFASAATQPMAEALRNPQALASTAPSPSLRTAAVMAAPPCAFEPLLAPTSAADQQFNLRAALAGDDQPKASAFIAVARETAAANRQRDAEVALIVACRLAARASRSPSVQLADVQASLGQHYAEWGPRQPAQEQQDEAQSRAERLLEASVAGYTAVLGKNSSKTRMAERRRVALTRDEGGPAAPLQTAASESPVLMGAAPMQSSQPLDAAAIEAVAVDSDPQLAQLERDLSRLRAQAGSVTRDPEGMRQRAARAQSQRAACHDKACMLRWYAQRRSDLLEEF